MRKMQFNSDVASVNDYVKKLQAKFPNYTVTINNVNDFALMAQEQENCANCQGLNNCQNAIKGCINKYDLNTDSFSLNQCQYKIEANQKSTKDSLIKTLYLPTKILEANISNFDVNSESRKKIYNHLVNFVQNYNNNEMCKGLYLYGSFSIGKTFTLACIANELAKKNISCLLIYFPDLVVDLKSALCTPRFGELFNMLKEVDVLMLDDLGSENMTPWLRDEVLGPILNYRVLENKPLFVTSNISPSDMRNNFLVDKGPQNMLKADRLMSRMTALMYTVSMDDSQKYRR